MITWLLANAMPWLIGLAAAIAALFAAYTRGRKDARDKGALAAAEAQDKQEAKEKRATVGADNRDLLDRLRGRDGDWGGL